MLSPDDKDYIRGKATIKLLSDPGYKAKRRNESNEMEGNGLGSPQSKKSKVKSMFPDETEIADEFESPRRSNPTPNHRINGSSLSKKRTTHPLPKHHNNVMEDLLTRTPPSAIKNAVGGGTANKSGTCVGNKKDGLFDLTNTESLDSDDSGEVFYTAKHKKSPDVDQNIRRRWSDKNGGLNRSSTNSTACYATDLFNRTTSTQPGQLHHDATINANEFGVLFKFFSENSVAVIAVVFFAIIGVMAIFKVVFMAI